jgi:NAD(P)-dependent dehydrogenase (short-subunit alcohol dehydrogenase family)
VSNSENESTPLGAAARRFDLTDRVVVVTGALKGIGRELTILLAETGAAHGRRRRGCHYGRGLTVHPQRLDVRDVTSINEAVSRILAAHGCIDVLATMRVLASRAPPSMSPKPTGTR